MKKKVESNSEFIKILSYLTLIVLFIVVLRLIYFSYFWPFSQDEGVFLTIARGIVDDKVPYLDFFDHKPPGIYFISAFFISIFSSSFDYLRIGVFIFNFLTAGIIFWIGKKIWNNFVGFWAALFYLFTLTVYEGHYILTEPFLAFFVTLSVLFFVLDLKKSNNIWPALAGLSLGLAVIFKPTAVINFLILGVVFYFSFSKSGKEKLLLYILGTLIPVCLVVFYFYSKDALSEAWRQSIVLNFTSYPREALQKVLLWVYFMIKETVAIWILTLFSGTYFFSRRKRRLNDFWIFWVLILFLILPIPVFLFRHYPHYWIQILPFLSILAAAGLSKILEVQKIKLELLKIILLALVLFNIILTSQNFIERTKNKGISVYKEQKKIVEEIKNLVPKEEKILTENQFVAFYFLSNREPLTKFLYLTEINEKEDAIKTTKKEIIKNKPYILWPLDPSQAYSKDIQTYIFENYRVKKIFFENHLVIYEPKDNLD